MKTVAIPSHQVPALGSWDVVVCGGGPAGCGAALAAARHGARTLLVEKDGFLGGATVSQLVAVILSTNGVDFAGTWHEYMRRLSALGGLRGPFRLRGRKDIRGALDPELVKHVWDAMLSEAGVEILHHAYASEPVFDAARSVSGVVAETVAGRRAIFARRVVDATANGVVCAAAGVPWEQGDGSHPWAMALTKVFRMGNVGPLSGWLDEQSMAKLEADLDAAIARGDCKSPVITAKRRLLDYVRCAAWRLPERRREYLSVISRVLCADPLDPFDVTRAEREGRAQAWEAADFLRRHAPGFEKSYLLDTAADIGVRSSRRIRGRATVADADAIGFREYPDGIAKSSWSIDIWPADSYTAPAVDRTSEAAKKRRAALDAGAHFDIRYGCIVADGVSNLLMAGRCISASHVAESSLRVQQTCIATGEAAGTAAALSIAAGVPPDALDPGRVVAALASYRAGFAPFEIAEEPA